MKKWNLITVVALFGMFVFCSCDSGNDKNSGLMGVFKEFDNVMNEAIQKVRVAESVREIEAIEDWADNKIDMLQDKLYALGKKNPEEWRRVNRQIDEGYGEYYERNEEYRLLESKFRGLCEKRRSELSELERKGNGSRSEWGDLWE